jgi:hypothetical protein
VAWGYNYSGQCLGTDSQGFAINTTADGAFVKIGGVTLSGVTAIAGGGSHTIALKDGRVLAWGYKNLGQINIPAAAQSGVNAIAGGNNHTIALKGGSVIAWGDNSSGQCLGTYSSGSPNTNVAMGSSVQILGVTLSGVTAIAGGASHTIALKDGSVVAWGDNSNGQCTIPIAAQSGVTAIAGGGFHTIALKDGRVLAWGYNYFGQLNIPTDALSGVIAIEGGYYHTIALKYIDSNDIDADGIPNASDNCPNVTNPTQSDCDGNGVGDACELDCNHNGIADVCEILSGAVTDQNLNGIPDTCEVSSVSRVLPISGPSTGGTAVRIIGTNFFSALPVSVTFGGAPATNVVVVSLTEITAVTPAGSPGDTVVTVNGASVEAFYYRPSCDGDLDNNGTIDSSDLSLVLLNFGDCFLSLPTQRPQEPMIFAIPEAAKPVAVKK